MRTQLAVLSLLAASCGARSALLEGGGGSSAPGSGGSTGVSTSTSTGAAGGLPACTTFELASPVMSLEAEGVEEILPNLVELHTAPTTVAVVHGGWHVGTMPFGAPIRIASFDAWGTWPPAPPTVAEAQEEFALTPDIATLLAVSRRSATPDNAFSMIIGWGQFEAKLIREVDADGTLGSTVKYSANVALGLAPGPDDDRHLIVAATNTEVLDAWGYLNVNLEVAGKQQVIPFVAGCATTPLAGDAVSFSDGWMLGAALGMPFQWTKYTAHCGVDLSEIHEAKEITFAFIDSAAGTASTGSPIGDGTPVKRLRLAARSDGVWGVYTTSAAGLWLTRANATGSADPPALLDGAMGAIDPMKFGVASDGDALLLAAVETLAGGAQVITVRRIETGGKVTWSIPIMPGGAVDRDPVTLMASPAGDAVLVAWSELPAGAAAHRVRVARLGCPTP